MSLHIANFQRCAFPSKSGMSDIVACPSSPISDYPSVLPSLPPLPPPVNNSPCLFTQYQPLYVSCCTGLLYFSRCYQFRSVTQTLCDPLNCSTPGCPVLHHLPELAQTLVHRVSDATQPSHPLSSPFPPAFNLSQHQRLFQWISSSYQEAKVLELQFQHQVLPMNIQDWFPLGRTGLVSLQSKGLSRVFSYTIVQKHQFFGAQFSL